MLQEFKLLTGRSTEAGLEKDFVLKNYNKCLVDLTTFGEKKLSNNMSLVTSTRIPFKSKLYATCKGLQYSNQVNTIVLGASKLEIIGNIFTQGQCIKLLKNLIDIKAYLSYFFQNSKNVLCKNVAASWDADHLLGQTYPYIVRGDWGFCQKDGRNFPRKKYKLCVV